MPCAPLHARPGTQKFSVHSLQNGRSLVRTHSTPLVTLLNFNGLSTSRPIRGPVAREIRFYEAPLRPANGAAARFQMMHLGTAAVSLVAKQLGHLGKRKPETLARSGQLFRCHSLFASVHESSFSQMR